MAIAKIPNDRSCDGPTNTKDKPVETNNGIAAHPCDIKQYKNHQLYENKLILAPMVRMNCLSFRLLAIEYGADLVYSQELIDYRLVGCKRVVNPSNNTIEYIDAKGQLLFQTCELERERLVLQIGSNDPERAVKAAKIFADDVTAIDFNFGCPQSFSLKGGMGAALLSDPEKIKALLNTMIRDIKKPVSCKIRVFPQLEDTIRLVKMIEDCGVSAIAVHARTKRESTKYKNRDHFINEIVKSVSIPVIANGGSTDIKSYADVMRFKQSTQASSVMLARAAMANVSVFQKPKHNNDDPVSIFKVIDRFLNLSKNYSEHFSNLKWCVQMMMGSQLNTKTGAKLLVAREPKDIYQLFDIPCDDNDEESSRKKIKLDPGKESMKQLLNEG